MFGCVALAFIIGAIAFVAVKGFPQTVKDVYTDTKESLAASSQYQHTVMNASYSGVDES